MRYIISLLLCISFIYSISAQEPKSQNLLYADKYFEVEDYYLAAEFYQKVLEKDPQHGFAMYRLAECNMHFFDYDKAEIWFQRCYDINPTKYPKALYYHALMQKTNGKYLQATPNFEKFIALYQPESESDTYSELALLHYNGCLLALDVLKKPVRDYRFSNPGEGVNTSFSEFAPAVNQNDSSIVLASSRLTEKKEEVYGRFGEGYLNNYRFEKGEEKWDLITSEVAQDNFEVVNSKFNDGAGVFNTEKDKYYFTRCNEANAERTDYNCAIYVTNKLNEKWQNPIKLNENINPKGYWNAHPSLTLNSDTLFFVSKRPGGFGQHDIYYSVLENIEDPNSWGQAINMGDKVNTPYIEMSPSYYSEEKILFFASNGHEGFGGLDVFMAKGDSLNKIVNIGLPFNSNRDDFYFVLGDLRGYMTSNREGGFGNDDIYTFDIRSRETLIAEIESDSITDANTISIRGRILDDDGNPAPDVTVLLTDTLGNVLKMTMTDDNGVFLFANLDPSIDYRIILQDDDGRLTTEILYKIDDIKVFANKEQVNTTSLKDASTSTLASRVLFENIYFDFDKSILRPESIKVLDELAKYSKEHQNLKIEVSGHTDSKGSIDYNLKLAKRRGDAAYNYLVSKGVKKSSIIVNAIGLSSPIASNDNEVGRQLNRRVEFHIVGGGSFEATAMVYVVEPRVTLQEVAKKHNMSVEELKQMNNLTNDELDAYTPVRVRRTGDEDIISPLTMMSAKKSTDNKSTARKLSKKQEVNNTPLDNDKYVIINHTGYAEGVKYSKYDGSGYYIVLPRNTLFSIAKVCNVTPESIVELNDLQNQIIYPGQKLRISSDVSKPVSEIDNISSMADAGIKVSDQQGRTVEIGDEKRYVVKEGDTLYNICKQFNITMDQVRLWNNLDSYIVRPGMVLRVKE